MTFLDKLCTFRDKYAPKFLSFMEGYIYPFIVGLLVFVGHTLKIEFYCNFFVMLPACLYLILSKRIRGFLPALFMILYQITPEHSPINPGNSDYYFTNPVFAFLIITVALLVACFLYFFIRNIAPKLRLSSPLMIPLIFLSAAFLLGGVFSGEWIIKNLFYSVMQIFGYFMLFFTFYYGISEEDTDEFIKYITNLAIVVFAVISLELLVLYLTDEGLTAGGDISKVNVHLGWGMWNPIGYSITVLIPLIMRGALFGEKHRPLYLVLGVLAWVAAIFSMSRNAQLFSTLIMATCVIIGAFRGKNKVLYRILLGIGAAGAVALVSVLWGKLPSLITEFFYDNGRFDLWAKAIENFLSAPVFGKGFYGFGRGNDIAVFLPWLAHNTPLTFMSAMGGFGILAYGYYRFKTVVPFVKDASDDKIMLALPILVMLGMSFIDNYAFHVYTTFIYSLCLAVVFKMQDEKAKSEAAPIPAEGSPEAGE